MLCVDLSGFMLLLLVLVIKYEIFCQKERDCITFESVSIKPNDVWIICKILVQTVLNA